MPCYNPQPFWADRVVSTYNTLKHKLPAELKVILVNDGSTKNITEEDINGVKASIPEFRYISYDDNRGKGHAVRTGVAEADTELVIYTDIDFPYSTDSMVAVYNQLNSAGTDISAGVKNENYYKKVPAVRRYISKILRSMISLFFRIPITDTQCGLKGFNIAGKHVFLKTEIDRYLFDLEFIHTAHKSGLQINPVEVELNDFVVFSRNEL